MPHSLARRSGSHELPWEYEPQFWVTDNSSCTNFSVEEDRQDWNSSGAKHITGLVLSLIHSTWAERAWSCEACASFCSSTHNFGLLILFALLHKPLLKKFVCRLVRSALFTSCSFTIFLSDPSTGCYWKGQFHLSPARVSLFLKSSQWSW